MRGIPSISVILCTYKRPEYVLKAIESLQKQTLMEYELILVDNAVDNGLKENIETLNQNARVKVCYLPETQLGLHNAQHTGVRAARGDLFVFTDDDATFEPGWLQAYVDAFAAHPKMAAAGGPIHPVWEAPPPQWILNFIGDAKKFPILSFMEPFDDFQLAPENFSFYGVNMAIRRKDFFHVGGINPDSFGDIWLGNGETGLYYKLQEEGKLIGYIPEALVYHHILKERMTVSYFRERMANEGACAMYTLFHHDIPDTFQLSKHAVMTVISHVGLWIKAILRRGKTDPQSLWIQMNAAKTQTQLMYIMRLMFHEKFRKFVRKKDWLGTPSI